MVRLNYALLYGRLSKTPMSRKPKPKPSAKLAAGIGATVIRTRKQLHGDVSLRRLDPGVPMDVDNVDPAALAQNLERPVWNVDGPGIINLTNPLFALSVSESTRQEPVVQTDVHLEKPAVIKPKSPWTLFASRVSETPAAPHQESVVQTDVNRDKPTVVKPKSPWTLFASRVPETPAATRQESVVRTDIDLEKPAVIKPKSPWTLFASRVSEKTPASSRKRKAHEEFAEPAPVAKRARIDLPASSSKDELVDIPPTSTRSTPLSSRKRKVYEEFAEPAHIAKKARIDLPVSSAEFPISSRRAEKSRAMDEPVDVPPASLRKTEKARARDDPAESANITSSASSETVEELRLPVPVYRPIVTANMASSSRVKLEDIPLPSNILADVLVNVSSMSSNRPVENIAPSISLPRDPTFVQPENPSDVPDVTMFEDDYIDHSPIPDDVIMLEDDYVDLPPLIAGYVPEYGDDIQIDPIEVDGIPFNAGAIDVFAMLGYVPEFSEAMEVELVGASIPSGNLLGNVEAYHNPIINGAPYAGQLVVEENVFAPIAGTDLNLHVNGPLHSQPPLNIFPGNAGIADPPYDPREPLFAPRPEVQPLHGFPQAAPAPEALNAPTMTAVQEQGAGDRGELFNELFGDDEEEDEEEEEAGAADAFWTAEGDDLVEERGDDGDDSELEIII